MKKGKCASTGVPHLLDAPETQVRQPHVGTDLRTREDCIESYLFEH